MLSQKPDVTITITIITTTIIIIIIIIIIINTEIRESLRLLNFKLSVTKCKPRSSTVSSAMFNTPTLIFHSSNNY